MIREINKQYRELRKSVRGWEPEVTEFSDKVSDLFEALKKPVDLESVLAMAKFAEALPSEIRELKLRCTKHASHVNGDTFRYSVRLRSNNGFVDINTLNAGQRILKQYYDLAEQMIKYTLKELESDLTETNAHKAVCLHRDVARFHAYLETSSFEEIVWEKLEPQGDYLTDGYSLEACKTCIVDVAKRKTVQGLYLWDLKWDVERILRMIHAMESLVARIAIFGVARLELTPEQLDAIDPQ
ncbi:hypothetical protein [Vibrio phage phiKT1028]|nr:hypothetical protein [Vibrio phage phiKT1028]